MRRTRSNSQAGFTLIEMLVATLIMAIAVTALMSNLSTSTNNLLSASDIDRLTSLSKSKMDELIVQPGRMDGVYEGILDADAQGQVRGRWRALVTLAAMAPTGLDRLERIQLETWIQVGSKRRTLQLETYRRVPGSGGA
jgi:prepilin-type N-terminal cleavage/methylation domain-containing protein